MNIIDRIFDDSDFDQLNNMNRWNGVNRIKEETVAHHSYIVTMMTRLIVEEIFNDDLPKLQSTTYAIFHDFDEIFTGDVNHNVKHNSFNGVQIGDALDSFVSKKAKDKFGENPVNSALLISDILNHKVPKHIKDLVKVVDWLSMIFYLKKECTLGNKSLEVKFKYCVEKLKESCDTAINSLDFDTTVISDSTILNEIKNKQFN